MTDAEHAEQIQQLEDLYDAAMTLVEEQSKVIQRLGQIYEAMVERDAERKTAP